jgi:hypothetical protein
MLSYYNTPMLFHGNGEIGALNGPIKESSVDTKIDISVITMTDRNNRFKIC